jgi:uncharacterized membrane protein YhiD involved in acid resistance
VCRDGGCHGLEVAARLWVSAGEGLVWGRVSGKEESGAIISRSMVLAYFCILIIRHDS